MFGLMNRGALPKKVEQEFERLFARLKALWLVEHNENGTHRATPTGFDFVPIGAVTVWTTDTAPAGWAFCRGQQISRIDYKALFDVIGTTYGAGNGTTTFNVPDLQQRFALGKAAAGTGSALAGTGGAIDHSHSGGSISGSTASEATHTHSVDPPDTEVSGLGITIDRNLDGLTTSTHRTSDPSELPHVDIPSFTSGAGSAHAHDAGSLTVDATGTSNPPYLVLNYVILTGRI